MIYKKNRTLVNPKFCHLNYLNMQRFSNPHLAPFLGSVENLFPISSPANENLLSWASTVLWCSHCRIHRYVASSTVKSFMQTLLLGLISTPHIFSCRLSCDGWPWEHLVVLSTYPPSPPPPPPPPSPSPPPPPPRPKFAILDSTLQPSSPHPLHIMTASYGSEHRQETRGGIK